MNVSSEGVQMAISYGNLILESLPLDFVEISYPLEILSYFFEKISNYTGVYPKISPL
ncbi:hypothetical protein LSS_13294 [Leptospira santarosai serovar Shermani str. LT 821]|uniref:Uncharacterized protein n=1 Tax=Leptospira santarosai serovar Shermani str. LT 821 TaxID=758847 RepID=K8XZS0_9LEPT|nr:hypothetical protein LSS_13294 [Leptospira santarosai serovar Shermani str. LT 821]